MMDLNDDLCRTDFFDFVKLENGTNGLTPVAFIDSLDYGQPDGNNNLSATGGQIKTILDEMLMSDPLSSSADSLQHQNLELLSSIPWQSDQSLPQQNSDQNPPSWLINPGNEVTTLTNLLDPLFVSYDDAKIDQYFATPPSSDPGNPQQSAISSDLITTTFMSDTTTASPNSDDHLLTWQKSPDVFSDESLLRSALQAGGQQKMQIPTTVMQVSQKLQQQQQQTDMTELRKVLSFPPLANNPPQNHLVSSGSPTSSDQIMTDHQNIHQTVAPLTDLGSDSQYYELKVLDNVFIDPENVLPNVEELIMTRLTPQFNTTKVGEISEKKIHSTTLSAKWTYTTTPPSNDQKTPRKRSKKSPDLSKSPGQMSCDNSLSPGAGSPKSSQTSPSTNSTTSTGSSTSSNGVSRKERSLHYCNICCKGFKDKYSVNVHVRTHTGEKPFACTLCGKNFRQKAHLAKHYQTHAAKANNPHGKGNKRAVVTVAAS